jgi:hypothetical protein
MISKGALYRLVAITCTVIYTWVGFNLTKASITGQFAPEVCLFKRTTGVPCPFCGTTRSIMSILKGEWVQSILLNPLGLILTCIAVILPIWMLVDYLRGANSFYNLFNAIAHRFSFRGFMLLILFIIAMLWVWQWIVY